MALLDVGRLAITPYATQPRWKEKEVGGEVEGEGEEKKKEGAIIPVPRLTLARH
jgi:hypothetical protein